MFNRLALLALPMMMLIIIVPESYCLHEPSLGVILPLDTIMTTIVFSIEFIFFYALLRVILNDVFWNI